MGLNPKIWGKEGWKFIHFVAVTYHPSKEKDYREFFENIPNILPCPVCGDHFRNNMKNHPPDFKDAKSLFKWTVDMHNFVNEVNGKPKYSYQKALDDLFPKKGYILSDFANGLLVSVTVASIVLFLTRKLYKK